jgi:subtilisin family serine protease
MSDQTHRAVAGAAAATLAAGLLAAGPSPAAAAEGIGPSSTRTATPTAETHTVTLITGDVVTLTSASDGPGTARVEPGPNSTGGTQIQAIGDELHVVPDAALPFLASGRLDPDLFNVTGLVEQGYDDASVDAIPLIVEYGARMRSLPAAPRFSESTAHLQSINGAAIAADKETADRFWTTITPELGPAATNARFAGGIARVSLDSQVEASLSDTVAQVGAPEVWTDGLDGTGTTVAVLDTGVDVEHPDLADRVTQTQSFVPGETIVDANGHGTHVASTIAGSGAASDGVEKGVAPGARLVVGKVLSDGGTGAESWIIDGMEWASSQAPIVSMSLGSTEPSDGTDPMARAVDELSASRNTLFVIAAGNYGRVSGIGSPGAADAALTVGAVDKDDQRAWFQDMGPRLGDGLVKPEIVAPGVDVLAARSSAAGGSGYYQEMSGTSMATPHVAGAAAILVQQHPDWTGDQIKQALVSTARPLAGETAYEVGAGRLDIPSTVDGTVLATGSASFGEFDWPHGGDAPVDRTVTYTNLGDQPVTLALTEATTDADDEVAPEGLFTFSADEVTVPAHGTADVTVTAHPDEGAGGEMYSGTVVASAAGEQVAQTAVGLVKEEERYDLDIDTIDRQGGPGSGFVTLYRYGDQFVTTLEIDPATGQVPTQRLLPGTYNVTSWLPVTGPKGTDGVALVGTPAVTVGDDSEREVVLDAREANPITTRVAKKTVTTYRRPGYFYDSGIDSQFATFVNQYAVSPAIDHVYANPVSGLPGQMEFVTRWRRTAPLLDLSARTPSKRDLSPIYQGASRRFDGVARIGAVAAGDGTPEEIAAAGARGKVVLVRRSDVATWERAEAAQAAGARMLVVVNDGPGKLYEYAGGTDLPVVSLTRSEGQPLLDRLAAGKSVSFDVDGTEFPAYLYDLTPSYSGGIPANLSYAPAQRDLATVTNRFVGDRTGLALDSRADCRSWYWPPCLQVTEPVLPGSTRTDYVDTHAGNDWYEEVAHTDGWQLRGDRISYEKGERATRTWLDTVVRPRLGSGYWGPHRNGNFFAVNVPEASSGDTGVTGHMEDGESTIVSRLFADGTLIDESPFQAVQRPVPQTDGWATYRFEQDATRPAWTHSIESHTAWTFRAETTETEGQVLLPLLQLDYHLDTDLRGALRDGQKERLGLTAFHAEDVIGAGSIDAATLEVSYDDGATWREVSLKRTGDGSWSGEVRIPRGAEFGSLRASGSDDAGNTVEQEVIRAFSVR